MCFGWQSETDNSVSSAATPDDDAEANCRADNNDDCEFPRSHACHATSLLWNLSHGTSDKCTRPLGYLTSGTNSFGEVKCSSHHVIERMLPTCLAILPSASAYRRLCCYQCYHNYQTVHEWLTAWVPLRLHAGYKYWLFGVRCGCR